MYVDKRITSVFMFVNMKKESLEENVNQLGVQISP